MNPPKVNRYKLHFDVPEGYTALSFVLCVEDVALQVEFMCKVFEEAEVVHIEKDQHGVAIHAHVQLCDSVVMVRKATDQSQQTKNMIMTFPLRPRNAYEKALKLGAKSFMDTGDFDNETADWGFIDKQGTRWWVRYYEDRGPGPTLMKRFRRYALFPVKLVLYVIYKYVLRRDI